MRAHHTASFAGSCLALVFVFFLIPPGSTKENSGSSRIVEGPCTTISISAKSSNGYSLSGGGGENRELFIYQPDQTVLSAFKYRLASPGGSELLLYNPDKRFRLIYEQLAECESIISEPSGRSPPFSVC